MGFAARFSVGALVLHASLAASREARGDEAGACIAAAEKAQEQRDLGKYARTRQALLVCSRESCPAVVRQDCVKWLGEVERSTPTVVISARDTEGRDVASVRVLVDGSVLTEQLDGKPIAVDPGAHVFRYEVAGRAPIEEKVIVSAGERDRVLRVGLGAASTGASPAIAGGTGGTPPPTAPLSEPVARSGSTSTVGFAVGGAGLVAIGIGALFGIRAASQNSDAKALCPQAVCTNPDAESLSRSALTSANVANVAFGVGLVGLGVGTYLVLTGRSSSPPAPSKALAMRVAPLLGREVGGASVAGTW